MARPILFESSGAPYATGVTRFHDSAIAAPPPTGPRIYLEVLPEIWPVPVLAMLDTAAPWCIFEPMIVAKLRERVEIIRERVGLHSRLGFVRGDLGLGALRIVAEEGYDLNVQVLMFLSADWPGGNFIGYEGFLDRIRFAVDPHRNLFYFSPL